MNRREVLRTGSLAVFGGALAGCSASPLTGSESESDSEPVPVRLTALDVLNRRETDHTFHLAVEYEAEVITAVSREISGTTNSSKPTGVEFADWPDERGRYEFSFRLESDDPDWIRVEPMDVEPASEKADCYRMVFVVDLPGDVFAYSRKYCGDE